MPRKDPEEYKAYMRDYMQQRYKDKVVKPREAEKEKMEKFEVDKNTQNDFTKGLKEILGEELSNDDPVLKTIDKYGKYIGLGLKFFEGFAANMQSRQLESPQVEMVIPEKPQGYGTIHALKFKDDPAWQKQLQDYENYKATGQPIARTKNAAINTRDTSGFSSGMSQGEILRLKQENELLRRQMLQDKQEPKNLQQLQNKYPEPPVTNNAPPKQETSQPKSEEPNKEEQIAQMVIQQEIQEKVMGVVNFLNSQDIEDFKKLVDNFEKHEARELAKVKMAKMFLSSALKEAIKNTTPDELEELLKIHCKEKYDYLVQENKVQKYKDLFEKIRSMF